MPQVVSRFALVVFVRGLAATLLLFEGNGALFHVSQSYMGLSEVSGVVLVMHGWHLKRCSARFSKVSGFTLLVLRRYVEQASAKMTSCLRICASHALLGRHAPRKTYEALSSLRVHLKLLRDILSGPLGNVLTKSLVKCEGHCSRHYLFASAIYFNQLMRAQGWCAGASPFSDVVQPAFPFFFFF